MDTHAAVELIQSLRRAASAARSSAEGFRQVRRWSEAAYQDGIATGFAVAARDVQNAAPAAAVVIERLDAHAAAAAAYPRH